MLLGEGSEPRALVEGGRGRGGGRERRSAGRKKVGEGAAQFVSQKGRVSVEPVKACMPWGCAQGGARYCLLLANRAMPSAGKA